MKAERIFVETTIAQGIKKVARTLNIPEFQASIIVFFGLEKTDPWKMSFAEARLKFWRKELKQKIAMTL